MDRAFGKQTKGQRSETLSAYLDGQLNAADRARLEAQLANDPALRLELETLQQTVNLVHELPSVPIPHNFVLPAAGVARKAERPTARRIRSWSAPLLTAATAAASVLFAFVLAADLMGGTASQHTLSLTTGEKAASQVVLEAEAPPAAVEQAEAEKALPNEEILSPPPARVEVVEEAAAEDTEDLAEGVDAPPAAVFPDTREAPSVVAATPTAAFPETREAPPKAAVEEVPHQDAPAQSPAFEAEGGGGTGTATPPPMEEEERKAPSEGTPLALRDVPGADEAEEPAEEQIESTGGSRVDEGLTAAHVPLLPWHVLEIILGITAAVLAIATVLAWRARRR